MLCRLRQTHHALAHSRNVRYSVDTHEKLAELREVGTSSNQSRTLVNNILNRIGSKKGRRILPVISDIVKLCKSAKVYFPKVS